MPLLRELRSRRDAVAVDELLVVALSDLARHPAVCARRSKGSCQVVAIGPMGETDTPPD